MMPGSTVLPATSSVSRASAGVPGARIAATLPPLIATSAATPSVSGSTTVPPRTSRSKLMRPPSRRLFADFTRRRQPGEPAEADRAEQAVAGRIATGAAAAGEARGRAAAGKQVGDRLAVRPQHAAVEVDHQAALRMKKPRHDAADIEGLLERREREVAPAECIRDFAARRLVVVGERRTDGGFIELVERSQRRNRIGAL